MIKVVPSDVFSHNEKLKVDIKYIGNSLNKILVIKNFFSDPEFVRDYALNCTYVDEKVENNMANTGSKDTHWFTHRFSVSTYQYNNFLNEMKGQLYEDRNDTYSYYPKTFTFQYYDKLEKNIPHVDPCNYAGVLSLNLPHELYDVNSGTGFYRIKETGEEIIRSRTYKEILVSNAETSDFEMYHFEEHEFNSLILYESRLLHNPESDYSNWTSEVKRLTFNLFFW
jgi:hypothetical protein